MRAVSFLFTAALAAGCVDKQSFDETVGKEVCDHIQACDPEEFDATWEDEAACRRTVGNTFAGNCYVEHCNTFKQERAQECLREIRTADCEDNRLGDFEAACADVWSDCEGLALAACLISAGLDSLTE